MKGCKKFLIVLLLIISGCGCEKKEDENTGGIGPDDIVILSENQLSNFIKALPEILKFASDYQKTLTEKERKSPDANKKYFQTIRNSSRMKKVATDCGFKSVDELLAVYKNVVLSYVSIKTELKNFEKDITYLSNAILSNELIIKKGFESKKINEIEYKEKLKWVNIDKIRFSNIIIVKKFEGELDRIASNYNEQTD